MKRPTRSTIITTAVAVACAAALATAAVLWASDFQDTANAGKAEVKAGARSLASRDATAAASQFSAASRSFDRARSLLGPAWVGDIANVIPPVGRQFSAARTLVAIGRDGSNAGVELAVALRPTPSASGTADSTKLGALIGTSRAHIDAALVSLCAVADRAADLTDVGLVPPLARAVRSAKAALAEVAPFLDRSRSVLTLERYLLGKQRRILVVAQNSAELRPTGGFVGSYGILDVGPGGVTLEKYTDVYTLPDPPGIVQPPPGARMAKDFSFRDANWWIDYPTSARAMLAFWKDYGQEPVDGIIAVDVVTVRDLLEVFGPIHVASYKETFTADNLLDRLLYLVEIKSVGSPTKKGVLIALANDLERRVLDSGAEELARSGLALAKSADAKHVQFYFTDAGAQSAVAAMGWAGAIAPPAGTTDLLAVSNAMTRGGKINIAIRKTAAYDVALGPDGSAETTLDLGYSNTAPFALPRSQSTVFRDYLRVYRAPGTVFVPAAGPLARGATTTVDIGLPAAVRDFTLLRGMSHRETIATRVPSAWRGGRAAALPGSPVATGTATGSAPTTTDRLAHYRLFIVRQADLQDVPTTVTVTLPSGWRVSGAHSWKTASGTALSPRSDGVTVRLEMPLDGDVVLDIEMERR